MESHRAPHAPLRERERPWRSDLGDAEDRVHVRAHISIPYVVPRCSFVLAQHLTAPLTAPSRHTRRAPELFDPDETIVATKHQKSGPNNEYTAYTDRPKDWKARNRLRPSPLTTTLSGCTCCCFPTKRA